MLAKKICHIVSADITVRFLLMPQLKFLMSQGYDVHAVCSPGKLTHEIEREGIKVKSIFISRNISPLSDIISLWNLYWHFRQEKFDMVHTHAPKPGLLGQLAAKMAGVPVIVNTVHGLYFTEDSSFAKTMLFVIVDKIAGMCSTLIFSQNKEDIATMIKKGIAPAVKIRHLGNGIDVTRFDSKKYSPEFIDQKKQELHLPQDVVIIGTVGRLVKEKGYLDLFEAMQEIIKKYPKAVLLAVGPKEPEKKDALNSDIVKEYGLESNVLFLGERKDVEEIYPLMDIFVLASHREGFPRSVMEAMVAERPIVVTDIRGCREEIDNQKNGLMVPLKNPQKLAEAIIWLLENPEKAKEFAYNARQKALAEFDESLVFEKLKNTYAVLLGTKK